MADLADGESQEMQGSGSKPYILKNVGGVYSCTCPAWRNQSVGIERRTCKHLRKLRGDAAEEERLAGFGTALPAKPVKAAGEKAGPPLLLAESYAHTDPAGWWMSEKLDGVRAYWDGQQFISRLGNQYHAPEWFTAGLPNHPLDGELWIGRKAFQKTVGIVKRQDKPKTWEEVKYVLFDAPGIEKPFEARLEFLQNAVATWKNPYTSILEQVVCQNKEMLTTRLAEVESLGAEGLMLRQPGSKYVVGRSSTLLKVKSFLDADALVIGYEAGKGKHKGKTGSLLCELPNGKKFNVGTGLSDAERAAPPEIGTTIIFRYQELSDDGIPRFPSYVGVRAE
ncbi:MAG: DNA ligase [Fimbriiglobus sp.]